eukprot:9040360-Pyramimonas_sp.AAC.1
MQVRPVARDIRKAASRLCTICSKFCCSQAVDCIRIKLYGSRSSSRTGIASMPFVRLTKCTDDCKKSSPSGAGKVADVLSAALQML